MPRHMTRKATENQIMCLSRVFRPFDEPFIAWARNNLPYEIAHESIGLIQGKGFWYGQGDISGNHKAFEAFSHIKEIVKRLGYVRPCSTCKRPLEPINSTESCAC